MNKVYIYRHADDCVTIYYNEEYPKSHDIPVFEYEGEIPEGSGVLKTDGKMLYREAVAPEITPEPEPSTDDILNTLLGVTE